MLPLFVSVRQGAFTMLDTGQENLFTYHDCTVDERLTWQMVYDEHLKLLAKEML